MIFFSLLIFVKFGMFTNHISKNFIKKWNEYDII